VKRKFNPEMLVLAREFCGLTQAELAERAELSQGFVSLAEHAQKEPARESVDKLGVALSFPSSFFYQAENYTGFGLTLVFHRKRSSARVADLRQLQAEVCLRRIHMTRLLRCMDVTSSNEFTTMDLDEHSGDPELIAAFVRAHWRLPLGPIPNLIRVVEDAGGIVFRFSFGTLDVQAMSQWPVDSPPLFFVNADTPNDMARYSLAHEIGHVVMHRVPTENCETEANQFASELLMPAKAIACQIDNMSLKLAARLKPYWRVSMQSLIRRAKDLGRIPPDHYIRLCKQISAQGMRKNEPSPIAPEEPTLAGRIIAEFQRQNRHTQKQVAAILDISEDLFVRLYTPSDQKLRLVTG